MQDSKSSPTPETVHDKKKSKVSIKDNEKDNGVGDGYSGAGDGGNGTCI